MPVALSRTVTSKIHPVFFSVLGARARACTVPLISLLNLGYMPRASHIQRLTDGDAGTTAIPAPVNR